MILRPEQTYEQFNTNVFGGLNVARAFLPYMRPRKTGTIVWIGSLGGYRLVNGTTGGPIKNKLVTLLSQRPWRRRALLRNKICRQMYL